MNTKRKTKNKNKNNRKKKQKSLKWKPIMNRIHSSYTTTYAFVFFVRSDSLTRKCKKVKASPIQIKVNFLCSLSMFV